MSLSLENGINTLAAQIDAPTASFFESCVRCGMCADACLFYTETGDPRYTPIFKLEPMRKVWKQKYTLLGKLAAAFGLSKPVTDAELDEWQELLYNSCTLCGRCTLICPVGNDITAMIRKAREGMAASGHTPKGLRETTVRAIEQGGPMGIQLPALKRQVESAEKETGLSIPFDVKGAEVLMLLSSAEIMEFAEIIGATARIFEHAGVSWTFSSKAFEATNSGIQIGASDLAAELVQRIVDAAEELHVNTVISPECGHAYTALRWEGPNLIKRPFPFRVVHLIELLDELRQQGKIKLSSLEEEKLTFHDPCQMVRRGGVMQQPRNLLNMVASNFVEMPCHGLWNVCCGGGGGVSANSDADELRLRVFTAKKQQLDHLNVKTMVTACSNCRNMLEDGLEKYEMDVEVLGLTEVIADHLDTSNTEKPE